MVCWDDSMRVRDSNQPNRIIRQINSVVRIQLDSVEAVMEQEVFRLWSVIDSTILCLHVTEEIIQWRAAVTELLHRKAEKVFCWSVCQTK